MELANPQPGANPQSDVERMTAFLEREEQAEPAPQAEEQVAAPVEQQEPTVEQPQTDELTADDLPEEQAAADLSGDVFEIVHNGQQHKLSREEAIRYAQQGFDYTHKTEALAADRRALSERLQRLQEVETVQEVLAADYATVKAFEAQLAQYESVDWVKLATDEPLEYPKYRAQYDKLVQGWQMAARQYTQKRNAVSEQMAKIRADALAEEARKLPQINTAWSDPQKFRAASEEMQQYLAAQGMDPKQVADKYLDSAFAVKTLYQSMMYERLLKAKGEKVKQLRQAPPVVRPGASQPVATVKAERDKQAFDRLRKTGDLKDAAAALLTRL